MSSPIIDDRLVYPDSVPEVAEDFNRVMTAIDGVSSSIPTIQPQLFKVVFDSDGGSSVATQYVIEGDKVVEPADPTKSDYTFVAWVVGTGDDAEAYDFDAEVETHLTLKATWEAEG